MPALVVVGSTNPVKLQATQQGFERMFPQADFRFQILAAPSGVSNQPLSRAETLQGALNRASHAAQQRPDASFAVGIEGGVQANEGRLEVFAWVVVQGSGSTGRAQTGVFYLPDEVAQLVQAGKELGEADDIVFERANSKQQNGSIGLLTDDVITRTEYYVNAVIMALIPFKQSHLTWR